MAKLAAVLDSLDDVAEGVREFYTEVDGRFVLDADVDQHPATEKLRKTASARRREREEVEAQLKEWKDLGATPDEIRELREKARQAIDKGDKPDLDKLREKWVAEAKKEFEPVVSERDALRTELVKFKLTDRVRADYLAAGGFEEDAELAIKDNEGRFALGEKDKVQVLDEDGDPTGMTPREFFEKVYKKHRPKFFKGTGAAGGGATGGSGGSGDADLAKLSPAERLTELRRRGGK